MMLARRGVRRNSEIAIAFVVMTGLCHAAAADELKPTDETLKALLAAARQANNAYDWQNRENPLPRPHAALIPAFLAYADLRREGTDAIIALDWVAENAGHAERDPVKAATIIAGVTDRLEKMDKADKTVRESIAFAEYLRGNLLYLEQQATGFRSHDAVQSSVTEEKRVGEALAAFRKAAGANPDGEYGKRAAEFIPEIEHQRPGRKAPERIGADPAGKPVRVGDFKSQVVVLKFWGSWYGTAGDQFESEREALRRWRDRGVVVVLAETMGPGAPVRVTLLSEPDGKVDSAAVDSKEGERNTDWSLRGLPQTYVIDGDGVVRFASFSQKNEKLVDAVGALLKK